MVSDMITKSFILAILAQSSSTSFAGTKDEVNGFRPCKYLDQTSLPVIADECYKAFPNTYFVVSCGDGLKCLTKSKANSSLEKCSKRKDPSPNVNPTGSKLTLTSCKVDNGLTACGEERNSCRNPATFKKILYAQMSSYSQYQILNYPKQKVFFPTLVDFKVSKSFLERVNYKVVPGELPLDLSVTGVDYLIFISDSDVQTKTVYSIKDSKFISFEDAGVPECD